MLSKFIRYFLENKLVTAIILVAFIAWGISSAPFNWKSSWFPRDPVAVDAIPDIGENQQIVYTEWMGRSPQDIEDQITYPLTTALLGLPGVKTIRSSSIFGLSSIYIIFKDNVDFYWSRTRILEKLNSLPDGTLPSGLKPSLGPDATALGQVYWYTLEGRDKDGNPAGGWDPEELRSIQDFYVGYALTAVDGVSEVAPVGGFVKEYQVDIDPNAMKSNHVSIAQIMMAVKESNLDIGAQTIEFNRAEYLVRGLGYIKSLSDLEESVVAVNDNVPIRLKDVAHVKFGPATRRGGLDKGGSEAVGAVVVSRYGANPLETIENVKKKIKEIEPGMPSKTLADGTVSKVSIVPFYDREGLIKETLGTLESSLTHEILISILVVIVLLMNMRASILVSSLLPVAVLMAFIAMRYFGVDANVVALSGIAIAIGVMVDVAIVFTENIIRHAEMPENRGKKGRELLEVVYRAAVEVGSAIITALSTTIVSFLPVFAMQASEGKLFKPLAFTKTFAMLAALLIGLVVIPALAHTLLSIKFDTKRSKRIWNIALMVFGIALGVFKGSFLAIPLLLLAIVNITHEKWPERFRKRQSLVTTLLVLSTVLFFLTREWLPLGAANSLLTNFIFVALMILIILGVLMTIVHYYPQILAWALENKWKFLALPISIVIFGALSWQGIDRVFGFVPNATQRVGLNLRETGFWQKATAAFPGVGKEFMPPLNEGSFLLMPTTMPHSGIEENTEVIRMLDKAVASIPEVESVVGKWGRARSALDPAPISMFENTILYKPEYKVNEDGGRERFKVDREGNYLRDSSGQLISDRRGKYFRNWRPEIKSADDIWNEIISKANIPGMTSAPRLQPIQTRLIMISTGMRAPIGIKVFGPDLETIEKTGFDLENILKEVKGIEPSSVFADRVVGKPYLELRLKRNQLARYGLTVKDMQDYISVAVGGINLTTTVEGRERYPVRVRYAREFRDNPDDIMNVLIPTPAGPQVPLTELADIEYVRGPQIIKSENTFLNSYVIFDKKPNIAEVDVVENAQKLIQEKIEKGEFVVPAGVSFKFAGNYENQIRATKRLAVVVPLSLLLIFLILYFQFGKLPPASMVFTGIFVAFSGGFIMIWFYSQPWFMDFSVAGQNMRDLFQMHTINLSVAVWVGFIALFGIATDDGVIMGTYIKQVFEEEKPKTVKEIRAAILHAGTKRVRPAMMTAAVAIIALLPVLSSTGKGSDIMVPMAIPSFGGMLIQVITMFVVPVLYAMWQESKIKKIGR